MRALGQKALIERHAGDNETNWTLRATLSGATWEATQVMTVVTVKLPPNKILGAAGAALLLWGALLFAPASPALAQTPVPPAPSATPLSGDSDDRRVIEGDRTNFGGEFVLRSNETLRGDLAVFGGEVRLEPGSRVQGDVAMLGGRLIADGEISGDLSQLGGDVRIGSSAVVEGKAERIGGTRKVEEGAQIQQSGTDVEVPALPIPPLPAEPPAAPEAPAAPERSRTWWQRMTGRFQDVRPNVDFGFDGNGTGWKVLPGALLITLLAMLVAAAAPGNIALAAQTLREQPVLSGGVGLLSLVAGSIVLAVTLIFIITLCTNPFIALAAIGAGWTVTSRIAGEHLMRYLNRHNWAPLTQIMAGSAALALIGAIPIVGDIAGLAFVSLGLGALVLTRGGTRVYVAPAALPVAPSMAVAPRADTDPEP